MAITYSSADELGNTTEGFLEIRENTSGGWKSARLIIVVQMAERFAYFGIASNLIMYLTGPLGESTAAAAANVNAWTGTVAFLPLLGGFLADSYLGRFRTIIISSSLYILGLGLLSFSTMIPSHQSKDSNQLQETIFFFSLYLVAIGQGGYNPCIKVFGADQFDGNDHKEARDKSSFFNWLMFGNCISILTTRLVSTYIQENLSWSLGFGIPSVSMLLSLFLFLLGTTSYRFSTERVGKKNPFARISRVFMEALKNRRQPDLDIANANANETLLLLAHQSSKQFRFLDRAAISCELAEIEEAKAVLRLIPIWITSVVYTIVHAQSPTFFTKQGATMDRSISPGLLVPAATLQSFINLSVVVFIPIYDRLLVPFARSFTQNSSGITTLQRIGTGIFLSILAMVLAALVETKRLQAARDELSIPMSVWWLIPQYVIFGVSDMFTMVGLQEFFYGQVPSELRSVGMALNLSIYGAGNYLSSFMISVIDKITNQYGQRSWFDNDLDQAHLDYFYWLLAWESTAAAAANVNAWSGVSFLPLLGGFIADSFLGRFRTIVIAYSLYIMGLGLLSFSAMTSSNSKDPNQLQVILFFCSLYLIAIGQGGYKPCIKVFGADQFDGNDIKDAKDKSSYFNWLMFGSCVSILTFRLVSSYIQEDLSWSLGFGIPSVFMLLALFLFLLGTKTYRFSTAREGKKNPFARISHVFMAALKNRTQPDSYIANPNETLLTHQSSKQFRFLNKAAISCSFAEIEEAKAVLKLVPCG
ncbi:MFS transporter superfamily [Arabidopsis suecica]|nr:MFS transporter superfamily [Arabidopsis suecica]